MSQGTLLVLLAGHNAARAFYQRVGQTTLIRASAYGCIEVVKALLAAGADKEATDRVSGEVIEGDEVIA